MDIRCTGHTGDLTMEVVHNGQKVEFSPVFEYTLTDNSDDGDYFRAPTIDTEEEIGIDQIDVYDIEGDIIEVLQATDLTKEIHYLISEKIREYSERHGKYD